MSNKYPLHSEYSIATATLWKYYMISTGKYFQSAGEIWGEMVRRGRLWFGYEVPLRKAQLLIY